MIRGIIFDMDGVISDTQKLHAQVESNLLARFNIFISPEEITQRYSGVKTRDFFQALLSQQSNLYDLEDLMTEKWVEMKKMAQQKVDPIDGIFELLKLFKNKKFPIAVASASNGEYVRTVLKSLGIEHYFSAIVSGDMVQKGKPDPESFLLAAKMINISPEQCLVLEDGRSGMQAAKSANMKCIGLVSDLQKIYPTNNLVTSLREVTVNYIFSL